MVDLVEDGSVRQVPEPLSPRYRTRVLEVSTSYRSHGVKDEPESHNIAVARRWHGASWREERGPSRVPF